MQKVGKVARKSQENREKADKLKFWMAKRKDSKNFLIASSAHFRYPTKLRAKK